MFASTIRFTTVLLFFSGAFLVAQSLPHMSQTGQGPGALISATRFTDSRGQTGPIFSREYDSKDKVTGAAADVALKDHHNPCYNKDGSPKTGKFDKKFGNINGPSVVRWDDPDYGDGYYMFFAHHEGRSIRVASAPSPTGPWEIIKDPTQDADVNNLSFFNNGKNGLYNNGIQDHLDQHVASPDAHVLDGRLFLYVHGKPGDGQKGQRTLLLSGDSINDLRVRGNDTDFGDPYFRVFRVQNANGSMRTFGIAKSDTDAYGVLYRGGSASLNSDFAPVARLIHKMRHPAVLVRGNKVYVFFSLYKTFQEHIRYVEIDTQWSHNPADWTVSNDRELLRPAYDWETGGKSAKVSDTGVSKNDLNELRDPAILDDFTADNAPVYLYYTIKGEGGIAGARLQFN